MWAGTLNSCDIFDRLELRDVTYEAFELCHGYEVIMELLACEQRVGKEDVVGMDGIGIDGVTAGVGDIAGYIMWAIGG